MVNIKIYDLYLVIKNIRQSAKKENNQYRGSGIY